MTEFGPNGEDWHAIILAAKASYLVPEVDPDDVVEAFRVTQAGLEVEAKELPTSPKKYMTWAGKNAGWQVKAQVSKTWHEDTLYAADSKRKPGQEQPEHRKGDPKIAAHEEIHTGVYGAMIHDGTLLAKFRGMWLTKNGKTSFADALFWDTFSGEQMYEKQVGQFDDWLRILAPTGAPKVKAVETSLDPTMKTDKDGLWHG